MEKGSFHKLVELLRPSLEVNAFFGALRSPRNGAIAVEVRVAVALRILAGASYWDVTLMFGLSVPVTYQILWEVIDAINNTPAVGACDPPLTEEGCMRNANRFKEKSTDGVFSWVVAAVDGLFIKAKALCAKETANVIAYYSGSKSVLDERLGGMEWIHPIYIVAAHAHSKRRNVLAMGLDKTPILSGSVCVPFRYQKELFSTIADSSGVLQTEIIV
ncbi:unnamed protein product [Ectocarpus sp. CCAP 1310/34]|nr:unnamed protein product [Ectocarpus sp. CCAP 1310/34]